MGVYKIKEKSDGTIDRYKSRLVIKGFLQKFGIDYNETFSPTLKFASLRMMMNKIAKGKLSTRHADIGTAFLNGILEEEIYMEIPEGYSEIMGIPLPEGHNCLKLKKTLYGLKQASRQWHLHLKNTLENLGFSNNKLDPCLFKRVRNGETEYVAVYVDDLIIAAKDPKVISKLMDSLKSQYDLRDEGELNYFLGMNITKKTNGSFFLDQEKLAREVLERFNLLDPSVNSVPMQPDTTLNAADEDTKSDEYFHGEYRQAVGSLLYLACVSRPDIAYAVSKVAQYGHCPLKAHWTAVKGILRYLKGTANWGITLGSHTSDESPSTLFCSCDASFAGDTDCRFSTKSNLYVGGRKSHTGYVMWLDNSPITWKSFRQSRVALSSTEAEIIALVSATQEIMWLKEILEWIDPECNKEPIRVEQDNSSSIHLVDKKTLNKRSRHYGKDYFFVAEKVEDYTIKLMKQGTKMITSDILTKALSKQDFHRHSKTLMTTVQGKLVQIPSSRAREEFVQHSSHISQITQQAVNIPYSKWAIHAGG